MIERPGLKRQTSDRIGDLIASTLELEEEPFVGRPIGPLADYVQLLPKSVEPVIARLKDGQERLAFAEMDALGIAGILVGIGSGRGGGRNEIRHGALLKRIF